MKSIEQLPFTQWADIHRTKRFICVEPLSGYRMMQREDDGYLIYLLPDVSDEALGQSLFDALARSRTVSPRDEPEFFKWQRSARCDRNWWRDFMQRYGYKTRREAYQTMDWVRAKRSEGQISLEPHKRDKPGRWIWLPADQTVMILATTDAAAAGAALRSALNRCG